MVAGMSCVRPWVLSAEVVEFIVVGKTFFLAFDVGFRDIVLECDNFCVINAIRLKEEGIVEAGAVVADTIRRLLIVVILIFLL